jgi:anthranilate 1,2-dioxygenase small subunit
VRVDVGLHLRVEVEDLYAAYVDALDEGPLEAWPALFTEDCLYKVVSRENWERGLPLAAMLCESRGALEDRVQALRETQMYAPRRLRHLVGPLRLRPVDGGGDDDVTVETNYAVFQTLIDDETRVFNVGRYHDRIVRNDGTMRFREKVCVFDSVLVPTSLVFPV